MSKLDHQKRARADRARRHGAETADDLGPIFPTKPRPAKSRPSKAALRSEADKAIGKITRTITCGGCGHSADVLLPASVAGKRLRCSVCKRVAS
ncbi:hypothetical protein FY133_01065 [Agrobacterium tumefaciens]|uniref:hypothetical protein n=1 Tax=Agrobacterium tumefaciens TaxID=358 RepID=UPI0021D312A5|nr:hypothetical protein [Agrobacterium tumefaciens]UXS08202.1 hypothetical protein FY155_00760 [Agrobacterium tumefaciens]UXS15565.1 hypothetical protein FY154_00760 [Agrobacterium tumefaciens]UXT64234.1 hypothetical protein FY133_01065 [Agrobacterium tumefaciens]